MLYKDKDKGTATRWFNGAKAGVFNLARLFATEKVPGGEYSLNRTKATLYYEGLAPKNYTVTDIEIQEDYDNLIDQALRWSVLDGRQQIRLDLTMYIERDPN